jgi:uncharacterized protein with HEPN domain
MPHDPRKLLEDIRLAAVRVQRFTAGETAEGYATNDLLQSAVERQFEIAAEALNRILKLAPDLATRITEYRRIIDFRNLLSHGYDLVDDAIVWDVVQKNLPILQREVEDLLASLGESESPTE